MRYAHRIQSSFAATLFLGWTLSLPLSAQDRPSVLFSSLYGGSETDDCDAVAVDRLGNTYLGCHVNSPDLPGSDRYPYVLSTDMDAVVVKLGGGDNSVAYIAHWGGGNWDAIQGLVADDAGNVYAVGVTYSADLQVSSSAAQTSFGGSSDVFLAKIDPSGNVLWTTFFGGEGDEDSQASDIVLDVHGNIHIAGRTLSHNLPVTDDAYQKESAGGADAFVATFDANGRMTYLTYLGGSGDDVGAGLAIDGDGRRFLSGYTNSSDFPAAGVLEEGLSGSEDVFVTVLGARGNALEFSAYFGGSGSDRAVSIGLGDSGTVIVAGDTDSPDLATTVEASAFGGGRSDAFVARIDTARPAVEHLSYLGGSGADQMLNLKMSGARTAVLVGDTKSSNFPVSYDFRPAANEAGDGYIALFDIEDMSAPTLILSGGTAQDFFEGVAIGTDGLITVSGGSASTDLPTVMPLQTELMGGRFDVFVARFRP